MKCILTLTSHGCRREVSAAVCSDHVYLSDSKENSVSDSSPTSFSWKSLGSGNYGPKHWLIALMAAMFVLSPGLYATTYFVAPNGNDGSPGTQDAPFATIQRGVNLARAGDTISVADGTYGPNGRYTCGIQCGSYSAPVTISYSGTASAPITIAAQNKWGATLDCQLPYGYSGDGTDGIQACDAYFFFQGSASYITISGFDIQRAFWTGAMVNQNNSHISFIGNHFHNIGNRIYSVPSGTSSYGIEAVYAGTSASYITWDGNEFNNIGRLPHPGSIINDDYSHDHGLYLYNGPYTITNNIFYGQAAGWNIQTSPGSHDMAIANNTFIGGANPQKNGCLMLWGQNTNVTLQNNIFYGGRGYAIDNYATVQLGSTADHNIIYGSSGGLIGAISGLLLSLSNQLNTDPLFVSPATNDYHLQAGSPAIDTGTSVMVPIDFDGNPRPIGPAFDVGAYEYGGTGSTGSLGAPGAPSSLAATAVSSNAINVTWSDNAPVATTWYVVQMSNDNVNFTDVAALPGAATSWSSTQLAANTPYYYRVRAQNAAGTSGYSNSAGATTSGSGNFSAPGPAVPAAPSNVAAGQSSVSPQTQINVYWTDNSGNETGFAIFRSTDRVNFTQVGTVGPNVTQFDNSGLNTNTRYYYYVQAYSASGMSVPSNIDSAITQP
jgi:hypothetical protein